jgi:hypothetical protein
MEPAPVFFEASFCKINFVAPISPPPFWRAGLNPAGQSETGVSLASQALAKSAALLVAGSLHTSPG